MTGIIGAMHIEVETIKSLMENKTAEKISGVEYVKGTLHGREIVIAVCGIGKVAAAMCTQTMILKYAPDCVINTGVGGSLSTKLAIGDIAVAESLVQHDMDTSPLGDPVGMISGINLVKLPASKSLVKKITAAADRIGLPYACGVIASGDQFIADREKKDWIRDTFDAIACEMEGAAIGQVAYVNGVDFAVLRAISDNADDAAGSMDYPTLCERAAKQTQILIEALFA